MRRWPTRFGFGSRSGLHHVCQAGCPLQGKQIKYKKDSIYDWSKTYRLIFSTEHFYSSDIKGNWNIWEKPSERSRTFLLCSFVSKDDFSCCTDITIIHNFWMALETRKWNYLVYTSCHKPVQIAINTMSQNTILSLIQLFFSIRGTKERAKALGYLVDCSGHRADPPRLHRCPHPSQSRTGPAAALWLHCHGPALPGPCTHKSITSSTLNTSTF